MLYFFSCFWFWNLGSVRSYVFIVAESLLFGFGAFIEIFYIDSIKNNDCHNACGTNRLTYIMALLLLASVKLLTSSFCQFFPYKYCLVWEFYFFKVS
ncbi:hypothetical protein QQP08_015592 [Theobroma cacao]|nr:hypothetical protein QQP08_015592 [Theobroma cacao]